MARSSDNAILVKIKNFFLGFASEEVRSGIKLESVITCPFCGFQQKEKMPINVCVAYYVCLNCKKVMHAKEGECCVFCSYGDTKCPSKQKEPALNNLP